MKKVLVGILGLLLGVFLYTAYNQQSFFIEYKLNNKTYKLLTAKNSQEWAKGLMNYRDKKELNGADGMIFIFSDKKQRSFWNMNTYLDLDVYWLDNGEIVGKDYLPSILKSKEIVTIESKVGVNKVIEIIR